MGFLLLIDKDFFIFFNVNKASNFSHKELKQDSLQNPDTI